MAAHKRRFELQKGPSDAYLSGDLIISGDVDHKVKG